MGFILLKKIKKKDFIVTNCDTLINFDINKIYGFHLKSKNIMTIISSNKNVKIPYGVLEIKRKKYLGKIIEKPQYNFNINTGVYFLNKKIFKYFKKEKKIDMNDLINLLIRNKENIGVYSIKNTEWNDLEIGKNIKDLITKHFRKMTQTDLFNLKEKNLCAWRIRFDWLKTCEMIHDLGALVTNLDIKKIKTKKKYKSIYFDSTKISNSEKNY